MTRKRLLIGFCIFFTLLATWFLAVDCSWFEERCPDCLEGRSILQYRIGGYVVSQSASGNHSDIYRTSIDLGVPCQHPDLSRWHHCRFWGLVICRCPCISGTTGLSHDETWYDHDMPSKVQLLRITRPELGEEFRQRVLVEHDFEYWNALRAELKDKKPD